MNIALVYITTKDKDEAMRIGRELVTLRLAACVNVVDGMTSLYWWEDSIHKDHEAILIAKTTKAQVSALMTKVKEMHSYEVPCMLELDVTKGFAPYVRWLEGNVAGAKPRTRKPVRK
jgi:periplasmic divalent cation tolerance protein